MRALRHAVEPYPVGLAASRERSAATTGADATLRSARATVVAWGSLPLPGGGGTWQRWRALADLARHDLSLVRLVEGHADAQAILSELQHPVPDGLLGVWAARPQSLLAEPYDSGWKFTGEKPFCSGSTGIDHALVAATAPDGAALFCIPTKGLTPVVGSWETVGIRATRSETIVFDGVVVPRSARVGGTDAYVDRPGFAHGGCGVAACWWGGTLGVLDDLALYGPQAPLLPSEILEVQRLAGAAEQDLRRAATLIDADPLDRLQAATLAASLRVTSVETARRGIDVAGRHLGTTGLAQPAVGQRLADLTMYLSQHKSASPPAVA